MEMLNYQTQLRVEMKPQKEGLEQVGKNDMCNVVSERPPKKKERFELTETSAKSIFKRIAKTEQIF